jgi:hypothetical protein
MTYEAGSVTVVRRRVVFVCPAPEDTPMGPEQSRSKMVSLQDFDLIRVGLGLEKRKCLL